MWTLHAAAEQGYTGPAAEWPDPWKAGRRRPPTARTDKIPPRLALLREGAEDDVHLRWRPHASEAALPTPDPVSA